MLTTDFDTDDMRIGILGDIHSNLEALEAVVERVRGIGVDHWVQVGDIVGYGAQPRECIRLVRELNCTICLGNHDAAVVGLLLPVLLPDKKNSKPLPNRRSTISASLTYQTERKPSNGYRTARGRRSCEQMYPATGTGERAVRKNAGAGRWTLRS